uniref:Immunoglobulin V-set domain-containing protein n=1 Tax=Astyanax mexicanus TaxID=7994 RepID=A0A3B1JMZ6_ASTMX
WHPWLRLFCFTAGISDVPTVTGYRGSSVEIRCPYDSGYETNMKYLCRGACSNLPLGNKDIPVKSGSTAKDQRFSLKDDTAARVFTVTITDLRPEDAGQYWCGIKRSLPPTDFVRFRSGD